MVRSAFENSRTKFRRTRDVVGVEICASVKNVMAIASGILEGMGVTDSTRALFLTESLNDIKELIHALGGKKNTILSFAGFGDILMTCTSHTSRNFSFGYIIGKGASQSEIDEYLLNTTVEGMYTLKSIHNLYFHLVNFETDLTVLSNVHVSAYVHVISLCVRLYVLVGQLYFLALQVSSL
jgi:glycerol-3-phosphate dehydrogenase (NAD(P)+)